ncbi:DNA POLYMERASE I (POL I) [Mycoplasmopsis pulmonis]|uniref:5'-3' exonuclease n=1 Tax=Mycoplasmopsis pulmonis (strain UAB CTIP) TaxID=272635 RepID=EX53_MYCPU|nr:5'-3' exonuclease [Mycoplasmopsis pulmonis]Q98PK2.1 RecName: Full=5'-3' exonuclease [Mycoplasmopsis pulmonis UAB CTIP]MDZ7293428.1 5'-3' exonuclease [Mycoplasmopsis pulmonis]CAC13893.1 DNA POLYMERASE I (POL I) [Mycoplasmopsis pulmonis]VEU68485.1 DNA polymerase I [Mycoplasmopsis pulmonis]
MTKSGSKSEKFLLIDGNYLVHRSYYVSFKFKNNFRSTIYLFFQTIIKIIKNLNPENIFIAFDEEGGTWRHDLCKEYKSQRSKMEDEFWNIFKAIREILDSINLNSGGFRGHEADDVIATITSKFKDENQIYIFSRDKDLLQLIDKNVYITHDNELKNLISIENFYQNFQLEPDQIVDFKAIAGDSSDNLKGIAGIGEKGAKNLLNNFKSLEKIFDSLESTNLISKAQKQKIRDGKEQALFLKKIVTLNKEVPMKLEKELFAIKININEEILEKLDKYDSRYVLKQFEKALESDDYLW